MDKEIEFKLKEIIGNGRLDAETALARVFNLGIIYGLETVLRFNDVLFDGYEKIESPEAKNAVESIKNSQEKWLNDYKKTLKRSKS